jgi:hypothetical protein
MSRLLLGEKMIENLEIRKIGKWEVIMTDRSGFWFPLVINGKVAKFSSLEQATSWLMD